MNIIPGAVMKPIFPKYMLAHSTKISIATGGGASPSQYLAGLFLASYAPTGTSTVTSTGGPQCSRACTSGSPPTPAAMCALI